jgi:hypothetical protein
MERMVRGRAEMGGEGGPVEGGKGVGNRKLDRGMEREGWREGKKEERDGWALTVQGGWDGLAFGNTLLLCAYSNGYLFSGQLES